MTRVRQRASLPVDAVKLALERERQKREDIKPIELLKVALSAYLAFTFNEDDASATGGKTPRESTDSAALAEEPRQRSTGCSSTRTIGAPPMNRAFSTPVPSQKMPSCACRPFRFGRRTPSS